jgi:hypothetical protein
MLALCSDPGMLRVLEISSGTELLRWTQEAHAVAFSRDSKKLAAGGKGEALVWQLMPGGSRELSGEELDKRWDELSRKDGATATEALRRLSEGGPGAVTYLHRRLAERTIDSDRLKKLCLDLTGDDVELREKASRELADSAHDPALWSAIEATQSEEARGRARMIGDLEQRTPVESIQTLRRIRAIWALELLGAGDVLLELSKGPPAARQTTEARAATDRLRSAK